MSLRKYWPVNENDVYVRVFDEILNELDHDLLNKQLIGDYQSLSPQCRYLLTRTYLRSAKWIRKEQYEKYLSPDTVETVAKELVERQWLLNSPPLECLIADIASQRELQDVAKTLGLKNTATMTRNKLVDQLIQLEKQQAFFNSGRIATKISELLTVEAYFLAPRRRDFFFQLEQMFLFPIGPDTTLDVIFLTHMKKHAFYKYNYVTQRDSPLFSNREEFEAYAKARKVCIPYEEALALNQLKIPECLISCENFATVETGLIESIANGYRQAGRIYGRCIYNVSQLLMKLHRFSDEYIWVQKYLDQTAHKTKRGLALLRKLLLELRFLDESCTNGESSWLVSALNTYYDAIAEVSDIEMLDLQRKTVKLISSIRNTGLKSAIPIVQSSLTSTKPKSQVPVVEVIAIPLKSLDNPTGPGTRLTFGEGVTVEQLALLHYEGYRGGHFENSMMLTIFWLLFYDLLFSDPNEFRCAYHSRPMNIQRVISGQQEIIHNRMKGDNLLTLVLENRRDLISKYGETRPLIGGINWFIPESNLVGVMEGLEYEKLRAILSRIMSDYHKYASGFPDLTIWNADKRHTKFVEVKSENDTVSDNQLLWMEYLLEHGIDVEICKVIPEKRTNKRKRG